MKPMADGQEKIRLMLQARCVEDSLSTCCEYLAQTIRNGRIRQSLRDFTRSGRDAGQRLLFLVREQGMSDCSVRDNCDVCRVRMTDFSTDGAVQIGFEMSRQAESVYRRLADTTESSIEQQSFQDDLKRIEQLKDVLAKERGRVHDPAPAAETFDSHCVPTFSKLFK